MAKIFYDHFLCLEEVIVEVHELKIDIIQKQEIIQLIDETFHHHTLKVILDDLPRKHHEEFLEHFHHHPGNHKLLEFVKTKGSGKIEDKIRKQSKKIREQILELIQKSSIR